MTIAPLLVALVLTAAADPCAPIETVAADAATAGEYRAVGDVERDAGRRESAAIAYRAAAARDPRDAASRAALEGLCRDQQGEAAFDRGLRLMRAGECRTAAPAFEEARAGGDRAAALLEGICWYQLDEPERARPLLREAEGDPGTQDSARFFLGVLALREGRGAEAAELLDAAADDRHLAPLAQDLSRAARRGGRVVTSFFAESGWDSNVDLAADGSPAPTGSGDGVSAATLALNLAPLGESGPFARVSGTWREQYQLHAFDMRGVGGAAGWQLGPDRRHLSVAYGYDYRDLGGAPYLSAHRVDVAARLDPAPAWTVGASYAARFETYLASTYADYSGLRHAAELDVAVDLGHRWGMAAAWRGGRDDARQSWLSWWEHGPRLSLRKGLSRALRAAVELAWAWRIYDAVDPVYQTVRSDAYADGVVALDVDVAARWTLRLSVVGRRAFSTVPELEYTKVVPMLGIGYSAGIW